MTTGTRLSIPVRNGAISIGDLIAWASDQYGIRTGKVWRITEKDFTFNIGVNTQGRYRMGSTEKVALYNMKNVHRLDQLIQSVKPVAA